MAIEEYFADGQEQQPEPGGDAGHSEESSADPTGEQMADEADTSATPDAEGKDDRMVPLPALKEERRKRQELAEKLSEMERQLAYVQGQQAAAQRTPEAPQEDPWDEDAVMSDLPGSFRKVEQRLEEKVREMRYRMSHAQARAMYEDYDQTMAHLQDAAKAIPHLGDAVARSDAPALTAYYAVKEYLDRQNAPKNEAERIEAEVKKRLEAELAKLGKAAPTPTPLSSARGTGAATAQNAEWSGPTPLTDLFGGR